MVFKGARKDASVSRAIHVSRGAVSQQHMALESQLKPAIGLRA